MDDFKKYWLINPKTLYLVWTYDTEQEALMFLRKNLEVFDSANMEESEKEEILRTNFIFKSRPSRK